MKATMISRIGLAVLAVGMVVSLESSQIYAAPALGPSDYGIVAAPKPDNGGEKGNSGNASGGQQGNGQGKAQGNSGENGKGGQASAGGGASGGSGSATSGGGQDKGQGANTSGPFDPTTPTAPSGNGSKDSTQTGNPKGGSQSGRPDAGQVGNADGKNPPGQVGKNPRGAGYECGSNQGVGQGNPAHSVGECTSTTPGGGTPPGVTPPGGTTPPPPPGVTPPGGGTTPPGQGTTPPGQGTTPPGQGTTHPEVGGSQGAPGTEEGGSTGIQLGTVGGAVSPTLAGGQSQEPAPSGSAGGAPSVSSSESRAGSAEVLGALPETVPALSGLGGASPVAPQPGLLPYTGDADQPSQIPALWMAAGVMLVIAGAFFRRMDLAAER